MCKQDNVPECVYVLSNMGTRKSVRVMPGWCEFLCEKCKRVNMLKDFIVHLCLCVQVHKYACVCFSEAVCVCPFL